MSGAALYLVVQARPKPERRAEARALLGRMIQASLAEDGCELMEFIAAEDTGDWLVFERWESRAQWEAHAATDRNARDGAELAPMLVEPLSLQFLAPA